MARYTRESRDRVRDAVDFVELVSARTDLRRAGANRYEGLCPFHEERTPSFGIDPVQKVYYCFGCQAAGDVFTFVQETEGVDFKGALELLADRGGIELEREQEDAREAERRRGRERLLELLTRTSAYYERCLWEGAEAGRAREYLRGRGLGEQALREFQVGYAPSAWDRVLLASLRNGFSEAELYATGLAQRSQQNGRPYDRFRARIMFPLADTRGRVLGFGARALDEDGEDRRGPKYLNTSDNTIYHKGLHLYGAHLARAHAARAGVSILCEGYTDVIALHQAGIRNAVGLMGTALTAEQVGELARMAPTVLLALDADSAGQEAMLRAAGLAARRKLELRVVPLPAGTDPAELVQREGAGAIEGAIRESLPFVRFRVERVLASGDHSSAEGRDRMVDELRPVFAMLGPRTMMRDELTQLVAGRLELKAGMIEALLARTTPPRERRQGPADPGAAGRVAERGARAGTSLSRREDTERAFLALCIASPAEGEAALSELDVESHFTSELLRRAARRLRGRLREPLLAGGEEGEDLDGDPQLKALLAELIVQAGAEPANPTMLPVQRLQLELALIDRQIQAARGQESGDVSELAHRKAEVKREFDGAYGRALEEMG
ncbi:MAG TPA: DNA primase [Solirubrobacteraceae bacterium]|nr:DNA primase [Solirubrobacteraceae bacterium]